MVEVVVVWGMVVVFRSKRTRLGVRGVRGGCWVLGLVIRTRDSSVSWSWGWEESSSFGDV